MLQKDTVIAELNRLIGRQVFYVYGGPSSGAVLDIHFTPTLPRSQPLPSPALPELYRNQEGETAIYIECAWRLKRGQILCGSGDSIDDVPSVFEIVGGLAGRTVTGAAVTEAEGILDPALTFDDGSVLRLFLDSGLDPRHGGYRVCHPGE